MMTRCTEKTGRAAWTLAALAVAAMSMPTGCSRPAHSEPAPAAKPAPPAARVKVQAVTLGELRETISLRGAAEPALDVTYAAETPGRVERLGFELGDHVDKGDTLARIDYATLRAQKRQAQAAHDLAVKSHRRLAALEAEKLASQQMVDEALTQVRSTEASVSMANVRLRQAKVRAQHHGLVAQKLVETGEYVNPGQPLYRVIDLDRVKFAAHVPERQVAQVEPGMKVQVHVDALDRTFEGKVDRVLPTAHPASHTFETQVEVENADHAILAGMSATVHITARVHEAVVVVPQDVVIESGGGRAVYVDVDGKAERRPVKLGAVEADRVVVTEGLEPGDRLVVEGHRELYAGQRIQVVGTAQAAIAGATRHASTAPPLTSAL